MTVEWEEDRPVALGGREGCDIDIIYQDRFIVLERFCPRYTHFSLLILSVICVFHSWTSAFSNSDNDPGMLIDLEK